VNELDKPAILTWKPPGCSVPGRPSHLQNFNSLREAVINVMEKRLVEVRTDAWIQCENRWYSFSEIRDLYRTLIVKPSKIALDC
jgi:hypothetical protein